MQAAKKTRIQGMSLVEVIISLSITTIVAAGMMSSALLFAKIANNHENHSDFQRDIRNGFEKLAFDTRNAESVTRNSDTMFTLTIPEENDVVYQYNANDSTLERSQSGTSTTVIIHNVTEFDLLRNSSESNSSLTFENDEIAIEELTVKIENAQDPDSTLNLSNFTFKLRNG